MYVATFVKVIYIGEIIGKLMVEMGKGSLQAKPTENFF